MKKKVLSALLVAAMSVSVLAGCGSKADNNTDAKNDASPGKHTERMVLGS